MKVCGIELLRFGNDIQLKGATFGDKENDYILLFPGEKEAADVQMLQPDLQGWQNIFRQTDIVETEVTGGDKNKKIILRKSQRNIDQNISWAVYRRDHYQCRYCGADDLPLTVDHLKTWESGGPTTIENMVSSCRKCNRTRGNTSYDEWLRSDYYKRVSRGLSEPVRKANIALVKEISNIPTVVHKRRRG